MTPPELRARALLRLLDAKETIARAREKTPVDDAGEKRKQEFLDLVDEVERVANRDQLRLSASTAYARHSAVERLRAAAKIGVAELDRETDKAGAGLRCAESSIMLAELLGVPFTDVSRHLATRSPEHVIDRIVLDGHVVRGRLVLP